MSSVHASDPRLAWLDSQPLHRKLNVLVIDDSAVVRQVLTAILSSDRAITVTTAPDPLIAEQKIAKELPDVILLDLEMPRMDGLTFLKRLMARHPLPVIVCSSVAERGTSIALRALAEGAVDVMHKPRLGAQRFLHESAVLFLDAVWAAAHARVRRRGGLTPVAPATPPRRSADAVLPRTPTKVTATTDRIVVIGASTGGTEALQELLESMPPDAPAIVIVQHMPEVFTKAFADRLNETCAIEVREAKHGDGLRPGLALIAPGNFHTMVQRGAGKYFVQVATGELVSRHRPSVDVLFRSAAQVAGANAVGVIMTGMGDDGARGLLEMKQAGAFTIAQDEATCVVFGMPKEAIALGAVDEVQPLPQIGPALLRFTNAPRAARA
jgi:two-component system chemotaxis response regulator CheB